MRIGTELKTIQIVAEEQEGVITLRPTDVNVYDMLLEDVHTNKGGSVATSTGISPAGRPDNASSDTITIREMLAGVKNADGKTYYQHIKNPETDSRTVLRAARRQPSRQPL